MGRVPQSVAVRTSPVSAPRNGAMRSASAAISFFADVGELAERLDGDQQPLALLAGAPQAADLAGDEHDTRTADRLPDPLAHGGVRNEQFAVTGSVQRVEVRKQPHALGLRLAGQFGLVLGECPGLRAVEVNADEPAGALPQRGGVRCGQACPVGQELGAGRAVGAQEAAGQLGAGVLERLGLRRQAEDGAAPLAPDDRQHAADTGSAP